MMRKKILLVDDSNTVLLTDRMLLAGCGYDIVAARDAEEGVAKAQSERPDLILLDLVMPKMDGLEAAKRIRALAKVRSVLGD